MKHHSTQHITGQCYCLFLQMQKQTTEVVPQDTNAGHSWSTQCSDSMFLFLVLVVFYGQQLNASVSLIKVLPCLRFGCS